MLPEEQAVRSALIKRFRARITLVDSDTGCCLWKGAVSNGHGKLYLRVAERDAFNGQTSVAAHLLAWWLCTGEIKPFIDRACGNALCVAPIHLREVTPAYRFWKRVEQRGPDECWSWQGGRHTFGYGSTFKGSAHKVAYELMNGRVPEGLVVRHTCHNPICCNPAHLTVGTQRDNIQDMMKAGRHNCGRDERAGLAKLTNVQVKALRETYERLSGGTKREQLDVLARLLDVTPATVWRIVTRRSYKGVP